MACPLANADEIRISGRVCSSQVRVVARDVRLSTVLARMAQSLGFELRFASEDDPLISIDASGQPVNLVARLAPSENLSVIQVRDPRCPEQQSIARVWVLAKGAEVSPRNALPKPAPAAPETAQPPQSGFDDMPGQAPDDTTH